MRRFFFAFLALAACIAGPAAADDKIGARTISPEQMLSELEAADDEMDRLIAEAAAHPLGGAKNPVRVGGPEGERAYLARLRCGDGSRPKVGPRGSAGVGAFGTIVNAYPLDCGSAAPGRLDLVMDMYHAEHREERAPAGFTLAPS